MWCKAIEMPSCASVGKIFRYWQNYAAFAERNRKAAKGLNIAGDGSADPLRLAFSNIREPAKRYRAGGGVATENIVLLLNANCLSPLPRRRDKTEYSMIQPVDVTKKEVILAAPPGRQQNRSRPSIKAAAAKLSC